MPQQNIPDTDLSDDEIAAALGFATTIGSQNLQASQMAEMGQQQSQMPQEEPQEEDTEPEKPEEKEEPEEDTEEVDDKLATLKEEMEKKFNQEIGALKERIEAALSDDDEEE